MIIDENGHEIVDRRFLQSRAHFSLAEIQVSASSDDAVFTIDRQNRNLRQNLPFFSQIPSLPIHNCLATKGNPAAADAN
ncbi:MAG: hypothetical protein IID46_08215 [Planctomycetes bacterium]|nr:hypothetical protein [Planctomycetota bacterium]